MAYAIPDGRVAMAATLWSGDNTSRSISNAVNAVSFQPDFVWVKNRSNSSFWNVLFDSVRGAGNQLSSNQTDAELASASNVAGKVSAFNSGGFSLVAGSSNIGSVNDSSYTYVGWQWNAGGTTVTNGVGTISSQVRANTTAGFSIVTYTGTGATGTVGHGLGVAPSFILIKSRNNADNWYAYHSAIGNTGALNPNLTSATYTSSTYWNNTSPTASVFTIGTVPSQSTWTYVAYCWAPVAGYSAFGSYTGNASTDGPFIYTGFRPRFVMIKGSTYASSWIIFDTSRSLYNESKLLLYPSDSGTEYTTAYGIDVLSNGFKLRQPTGYGSNNSGETYIYACFAENPLKYANAR